MAVPVLLLTVLVAARPAPVGLAAGPDSQLPRSAGLATAPDSQLQLSASGWPCPTGAELDSPAERAARCLEEIRFQPLLLYAFLRQMPKGGDLHSHLIGAVYAESLIEYGVEDGLCIVRATMTAVAPPCDAAGGGRAVES
jgi:adenosine deaminase